MAEKYVKVKTNIRIMRDDKVYEPGDIVSLPKSVIKNLPQGAVEEIKD